MLCPTLSESLALTLGYSFFDILLSQSRILWYLQGRQEKVNESLFSLIVFFHFIDRLPLPSEKYQTRL